MDTTLSLYWETARHLKPVQLWRRVWRPQPRTRPIHVALRPPEGRWVTPLEQTDPWLGGRRWRHLNQEREIVGWNDAGAGVEKLWLYQLHYMDAPRPETALWWIRENPPGQGIGWEPYPLSRRIANWVMWLLTTPPEKGVRRQIEESLAAQAEWLRQSVEWHLLANHILANAKALVLAGVYFRGVAAERWLRQGVEILCRELKEQIHDDGGHFELSPMYHALLLQDLLDLVNAAGTYPRVLKFEDSSWRHLAARMLGWLEQMTHPNGQIAYFNDAVLGVAAELRDLRNYADRLGVKPRRKPLGSSGYVRLEAGETVVLFDAGPVGPQYQPGHAHCDLLSLEISHAGLPVVTNTGVSTYEPGPRRLEERRTAAHNTLRVDGAEQSEVWESFRVARRACVLDRQTHGMQRADAGHDGYRSLPQGLTHWRRVEIENGLVIVRDRLEGRGSHKAEVFWHLAPGAPARIVEFGEGLTRREEKGWWCEGFGRRIERDTVVGEWQGSLPGELFTRLRVSSSEVVRTNSLAQSGGEQ
jgi:uncharacterized heparinase superfamily protein